MDLRGMGRLRATMQFQVVECDPATNEERQPFRVTTLGYNYKISNAEDGDLIRFHWHPRGAGSNPHPHVHALPNLETHVYMPRVTLETVIRACMEMGAPLTVDAGEAIKHRPSRRLRTCCTAAGATGPRVGLSHTALQSREPLKATRLLDTLAPHRPGPAPPSLTPATPRPASPPATAVQVGDELAGDAHAASGHVLLDPLGGQPGRGEPVAHGRRSRRDGALGHRQFRAGRCGFAQGSHYLPCRLLTATRTNAATPPTAQPTTAHVAPLATNAAMTPARVSANQRPTASGSARTRLTTGIIPQRAVTLSSSRPAFSLCPGVTGQRR